MSWYNNAKCRGDDLNNYDLQRQPAVKDKQAQARTLCAGCPVKRQCAIDAMEHDAWGTVRAGMWLPIMADTFRHERQRYIDGLASIAEVTA